MEIAPTGRPQQAASAAPVPRAEAPAAMNQVKTELPREQAVQQASENEAVQFENRPGLDARVALDQAFREAAARDVAIDRKVVVDETTRDLVFQNIDVETGEVVRQLPEEAVLKLRAYLQDRNAAAAASEHEIEARA